MEEEKAALHHALKQSQEAEAETKLSLEKVDYELATQEFHDRCHTDLMNEMKEDLREQYDKIYDLKLTNVKLQGENDKLKAEMGNLREMQTMQAEMHAMRVNMAMMAEQLVAKFKEHDEKLDKIHTHNAHIAASLTRIETTSFANNAASALRKRPRS